MKARDSEAATDNTASGKAASGQADRKARLAAELRANLARRKAQARSRRAGAADERPDGIDAAEGDAEGGRPSAGGRGGG